MATWTVNLIIPSSTPPADDIGRLTDALTLLRNNFEGATAPSGTGADAYMHWADTGNGLMKVADSMATAWVVVHRLDDASRPDDQVIWSNAADPTKKVKLDLSGLATAHTRTLKVQDRDGTLADLDDVQKDLPVYDAAATNVSNAYAVTLSPAPAALVDGLRVRLKVPAANTGAATLNVNGLGDQAIKKNVSADVEAGDLAAGQVVEVVFDGTNFQLLSSSPTSKQSFQVTEYTTPGTYTWTPNFTGYVDVVAVGGGGGGGGGDGSGGAGGGGGGAGATIRRRVAVTKGTGITITVGAKGAGGSLGAGGTGGDTSFGSLILAKGGVGGSLGGTSVGGAGGPSGGPDTTFGGQIIPATVSAGATSNSYALASVQGAMYSGGAGGKGSDTSTANGVAGGGCESYTGGIKGASAKGGGGGGASAFARGGAGGNGGGANGLAGTGYGAGGGGGAGGIGYLGGDGGTGYLRIEYIG